jgi:hypothetical protein
LRGCGFRARQYRRSASSLYLCHKLFEERKRKMENNPNKENEPNKVDWITAYLAGGTLLVSIVGVFITLYTEIQAPRNNEQRQLCVDAGDVTGTLAYRLNKQGNAGVNNVDLDNFKIFLAQKKDFIDNEEIRRNLQEYDEKLWHEQNPQNPKSNWYKCEPYNNDQQREQYKACEEPLYENLMRELSAISGNIQTTCRKSSGAISGRD